MTSNDYVFHRPAFLTRYSNTHRAVQLEVSRIPGILPYQYFSTLPLSFRYATLTVCEPSRLHATKEFLPMNCSDSLQKPKRPSAMGNTGSKGEPTWQRLGG